MQALCPAAGLGKCVLLRCKPGAPIGAACARSAPDSEHEERTLSVTVGDLLLQRLRQWGA
jgi:hypothetical protein